MIKVLSLPLSEDIGPLCSYLRSRGVPLRVIESAGKQELWVADAALAPAVQAAYESYKTDPGLRNHLVYRQESMPARGPATPGFRRQILEFPLLFVLLASLLLVGVYTGFGESASVRYFLIVDYLANPWQPRAFGWNELQASLQAGEWWRLLAPAWLHWGVMHFVFNCLGLWIFGRALEIALRSSGLLLFVLVSALVSNLCQFALTGPNFGGFSGVVYALIGAHLVALRMRPDLGLWMPPALIGLALFGLLVGLSGLTEMGGVSFANTAHLSGFLSGMVWMAMAIRLRIGLFR
jgi:GlpG protein